jgi:hypothetical protein
LFAGATKAEAAATRRARRKKERILANVERVMLLWLTVELCMVRTTRVRRGSALAV